ncbi:hypothetical protein D9M68_832540 [compost metagenome]
MPAPPLRVSFPAPPSMMSLPPLPLTMSTPPRAKMVSGSSVPSITSPPSVPAMTNAVAPKSLRTRLWMPSSCTAKSVASKMPLSLESANSRVLAAPMA